MADSPTSHGSVVPADDEFRSERAQWRQAMAADAALRQQAVDLQVSAEDHRYTYQWEWLGVPVIRLPDDIVVMQELVWETRPDRIVETGVARGGGLILSASLQQLAGIEPRVLGIDIQILGHTHEALAQHPLADGVELLEADSSGGAAIDSTRAFLEGSERALLVLDSNHTHDHVLAELRALAPLLPVGSRVVVADTLIEEFPEGHFADRPWDRGDNPLTAVRAFLAESDAYELDDAWSRRGLMSEFRDGVLRRAH